MRLSYIPTFAAVCRWGTFSRAAEKLHISQPAVSKAIKELEQDCGVALFERQHSTISLTPEGRKLWEGCQRWLKESEELEKLGTSLKTGRQILRIGVVPMCGNTIFPPAPPAVSGPASPLSDPYRGRHRQRAVRAPGPAGTGPDPVCHQPSAPGALSLQSHQEKPAGTICISEKSLGPEGIRILPGTGRRASRALS